MLLAVMNVLRERMRKLVCQGVHLEHLEQRDIKGASSSPKGAINDDGTGTMA